MGKTSEARYLDVAKPTRWVIVANRSETVIYRDLPGSHFKFVERLSNPEGQLMESELDSDRPGRGSTSTRGSTTRHGLDRRFTRHEGSARRFAAQVGQTLGRAATLKRFDKLVLVAEPHFLGLLRKSMSPNVRRAVEHEINRELAEGSDADILSYIRHTIRQSQQT